MMLISVVRSRILPLVMVLAALSFLGGCGEREKAPTHSIRMERTRATFFTDQKLPDLMNMAQPPPGTPQGDAWDLFAKAFEDAKGGNAAEAKKSLKSILSQTNLDTRYHLWAWSALRSLGEEPDPALKGKVQGLVVEVPTGSGVDTCAVYADGGVHYLANTDILTEADKTGPQSSNLVKEMLAVGQAELGAAQAVTNHPPLLKQEARLTLLTFGGNYSLSENGPKKNKWKMPEKITQNMNQLSLSILDDISKAKSARP